MGKWYVEQSGQAVGPLSDGQLKQKAQVGEVTPLTRLRRDGMAQWVKATSIKGLFPAVSTAPVAVSEPGSNPFDFFGTGVALPAEETHAVAESAAVTVATFDFGGATVATAPPHPTPPAKPSIPTVVGRDDSPSSLQFAVPTPRPGYTPPPMPAAPLPRRWTPPVAVPPRNELPLATPVDDDDIPMATAVIDEPAPTTRVANTAGGVLKGVPVELHGSDTVRSLDGTSSFTVSNGYLHAVTQLADSAPFEMYLRLDRIDAVLLGPRIDTARHGRSAGEPRWVLSVHAGGQAIGVACDEADGRVLVAALVGE